MRGSGLVGGVLAVVLLAASAAEAQPGADAQDAGAGAGEGEVISGTAASIHEIPHVTSAPEIDGALDDPLWRQALVLPLDVETNPRENVAAPIETYVYVAENGTHLLLAFDARDPEPEKIRAFLNDRDSSYDDDFVGVIMDTFNDQRRAFEFFVNPLGAQMDLTMDDVNGGESDAWDAIWESKGQINDEGFIVEMAIPFTQLRFQRSAEDQVWGFEALRFYPREDRLRLSTTPRDRGRNCYLCQLEKVIGFASVEPGRGLEIVPTATASRNDTRDATTGNLAAGDTESELGLGVRWAVTPDLVANVTLNPDFSQVEADVPQLEVNNQFALFYPETRPFFLEGADYFSTPIDAVFTRTVADPDAGAKLTGAIGPSTFGFFGADDAITNLQFPGPLRSTSASLDQSNTALVSRYRFGFGANSAIGALVTSRSGDDYHNDVAGFDGRYRFNDEHSLEFQFLASDTEYPDATATANGQPEGSFTGDAFRARYEFNTRDWFASVNYRDFDSGFRADAGFVSQVGVKEGGGNIGHVWHGDGDQWWDQLRVGISTQRMEGEDGQLLDRWNELFFGFNGPRQWYGQMGMFEQQQFWEGTLYDVTGIWGYTQARPGRGINLGLSWNVGDQIDFENSQLGEELRLEPWINVNAGRHLRLALQYTLSELDTKAGETIFDADLVDFRVTWQFNVRSFLRLTAQQQSIERNLAVYTNPATDALSKTRGQQLLYSYQLNPQTVVYAGYSDNYREDDDLPELTKTGRAFFLKLSYAWLP